MGKAKKSQNETNGGQMKNLKTVLLAGALSIALISCCKDPVGPKQNLNYEDSYYWVSLPSSVEKDADVFYVYPTVSSNASGSMDVTNDEERDLAQGIFTAQASLFEEHANVFAPYYRQMSTMVDMSGGGLATDTDEFKQCAVDLEDVFQY